ncbi:MAG: Gfo/Idh/MocA family oxidoreductase [Limnochordaceae bacterium]|nr:Gfo/Idh/MocA family oxidoreductase [Limnochordaceae bacterium]
MFKNASSVGFGIAGCDHWYAALAHAEQVKRDSRAHLVAVAHRDRKHAVEVAERYGETPDSVKVYDEYMEVVQDPQVEVVITACTAAENPALCLEAARLGKPVISVKPMAMDLQSAQAVAAAFRRKDLPFFPLETQTRFSPANQQAATWVHQGKLGTAVSALAVMQGGVPTHVWPGEPGVTWWTQPDKVPGGGWIDHAIYDIDLLRWLWQAEPVAVSGQTAKLLHPELELEDWGAATIRFSNGAMAIVEVTWSGTPGAPLGTFQLRGSQGALVLRDTFAGRAAVAGPATPFSGWTLYSPPAGGPNVVDVFLTHLLADEPLPVSVDDGVANLRTSLAFYQAAREGRTVVLSPLGEGDGA